MQFFEAINRIVFFLSLMLISGTGIFRVFLAAPLVNPGTRPEIQNFLLRIYKSVNSLGYLFWILLLGTGISEIILGTFIGASIIWITIAFVFYGSGICFEFLAYSVIRKNEFNLMATPEMERRKFGLLVYYSAISTVLLLVAISIISILV